MAQSSALRTSPPYPTACPKGEIRPMVLRNRKWRRGHFGNLQKKPGGQFQITTQDGSSSERRLVHREKLQLELTSHLFHSTNINLLF